MLECRMSKGTFSTLLVGTSRRVLALIVLKEWLEPTQPWQEAIPSPLPVDRVGQVLQILEGDSPSKYGGVTEIL